MAVYESSRLTFKRDIIEPLKPDEEFTVFVTKLRGSYTMTKSDFHRVFNNVVESDSYKILGSYNYKTPPGKADPFFTGH